MKRTYCTLFDKNYLYQALALHSSLLRHAGEFQLYALCMDQVAYDLLSKMRSNTLIPISVEELITPEIAAVRSRTGHGQFCWVCQPLICQFILDKFGVDMVTYLEADSLFFSNPEVLFEEMGNKSATLVPHNFSKEFNNEATAGVFCVQFNAFKSDSGAHELLSDWRQACFKYDKSAPKVYPGQTCLDSWPQRFSCVRVISHPGAGVAPWNVRGYRLEMVGSTPHVDGKPAVFYHFHQYGRYKSGAHELGHYPMTPQVIELFYRPYVLELRAAEAEVRKVDPSFAFRREYQVGSFAHVLEVLKRKARRRYNVYPDAHFG